MAQATKVTNECIASCLLLSFMAPGRAEQLATPSDLKPGEKSRKRKECSRNKENADRNTGAESPQATAHASWEEREKAASELGALDARKMLGEELPTTTSEKSALKQKVWTLLRFGVGCTFKHAAHAEYISSSSKCAHALRAFPSRREATCYLKAGADVLEGATTTEINKLLHASSASDRSQASSLNSMARDA